MTTRSPAFMVRTSAPTASTTRTSPASNITVARMVLTSCFRWVAGCRERETSTGRGRRRSAPQDRRPSARRGRPCWRTPETDARSSLPTAPTCSPIQLFRNHARSIHRTAEKSFSRKPARLLYLSVIVLDRRFFDFFDVLRHLLQGPCLVLQSLHLVLVALVL